MDQVLESGLGIESINFLEAANIKDMLLNDLDLDGLFPSLVSAGILTHEDRRILKASAQPPGDRRDINRRFIQRYKHVANSLNPLILCLRQCGCDFLADELTKCPSLRVGDAFDAGMQTGSFTLANHMAVSAVMPNVSVDPDQLSRILIDGNVPERPAVFVRRDDLVGRLRDCLRRLCVAEQRRVVVVHGIFGCGKSVLAAEALRDSSIIGATGLFSHVFWVKVGSLTVQDDDSGTFGREKILALFLNLLNCVTRLHELRTKFDPHLSGIQTLDLPSAKEQLKLNMLNFFPRGLLVLDDVLDFEVMRMFNIQYPVLVTSQRADIADMVHCKPLKMELSPGFTRTQSLSALGQWLEFAEDQLPAQFVSKLHEICCGHPLVISIVAAWLRRFKRDGVVPTDRWKYYIDLLEKNMDIKNPCNDGTHKSLSAAAQICLDDLQKQNPKLHQYYCELSVFELNARVTTAVLATYWNLPAVEVENVMLELQERSLAVVERQPRWDTNVYSLHYLLHRFLRQSVVSAEQRCSYHKKLLDAYLSAYKRYFSLPHDHYIYLYLAYHLHYAGQHDTLGNTYLDIQFLIPKIFTCGTSDTLMDFFVYGKSIESKGKLKKLEFQQFLRRNAHMFSVTSDDTRGLESLKSVVLQTALYEPPTSTVYEQARRCALALIEHSADGPVFLLKCNKSLSKQRLMFSMRVHNAKIVRAIMVPKADSSLALTCAEDKTIKITRLDLGAVNTVFTFSSILRACSLDRSQCTKLVVCEDGAVRLRDIVFDEERSLKVLSFGQGDNSPPVRKDSGSFHRSFEEAVNGTAGEDAALRATGEVVLQSANIGRILWCDFSHNGRFVAAAATNGVVFIWSTTGSVNQPLVTLRVSPRAVTSCAFAPPGDHLLVAGAADQVCYVYARTGDDWSKRCEYDGHAKRSTEMNVRSQMHAELLQKTDTEGNENWDVTRGVHCVFITRAEYRDHVFSLNAFECCVWDASTGTIKLRYVLNDHRIRHPSCAMVSQSPQGFTLAAGQHVHDKAISLSGLHFRHSESESAVLTSALTLHGHPATVSALGFSEDGKELLSGDEDGTLMLWNIEQLQSDAEWRFKKEFAMYATAAGVVVFGFEQLLGTPFCQVVPYADDDIGVLHSLVGQDSAFSSRAKCLEVARDGSCALFGFPRGRLMKMALPTYEELLCAKEVRPTQVDLTQDTSNGGMGSVRDVTISACSKLAASANKGGLVLVYDLQHDTLVAELQLTADSVPDVTLDLSVESANYATFVSGHTDTSAVLVVRYVNVLAAWCLVTKSVLWTFLSSDGPVLSFDVSLDGTLIAFHTATAIRVLNMVTGACSASFPAASAAVVQCVRFSPSGAQLAVGDARGAVRVWHLQEHDRLIQFITDGSVAAVHFADGDERLLMTLASDLRWWRLLPGNGGAELAQKYALHEAVTQLAVSNEHNVCCTVDSHGRLHVLQRLRVTAS